METLRGFNNGVRETGLSKHETSVWILAQNRLLMDFKRCVLKKEPFFVWLMLAFSNFYSRPHMNKTLVRNGCNY